MNELIEKIFANFNVEGISVPVKYLFYHGHNEPYITYEQVEIDNAFSGDDELIGYVEYYDFDIYSKGNNAKIIEKLKEKLKENNFTWQPSKSSRNMYETDTGYYHITLNFAILKEE